jgi:hypothetical protein
MKDNEIEDSEILEMDRDLRELAGKISAKLPVWFTDSQLSKMIGADKKKNTLSQLANVGLLRSGSRDGQWKHKIIGDPAERALALSERMDNVKTDIEQSKETLTLLQKLYIVVIKHV